MYRFRPSLWPTVAALLLVLLLLSLAAWQWQRAKDKQQLAALFDSRISAPPLVLNAPPLVRLSNITLDSNWWLWWRFRNVELTGRYHPQRQYLLDNRTHNGVAGYEVLTPFKLQQHGVYVIVNRGWTPIGASRQQLPLLSVDDRPRSLQGLITPPRQPFLLGDSGYHSGHWPQVVQSVDIDSIARTLPAPVLPFLVTLAAAGKEGFVPVAAPYLGISPTRHQAYALQWLSLAIAVIATYIIINLTRSRRDALS